VLTLAFHTQIILTLEKVAKITVAEVVSPDKYAIQGGSKRNMLWYALEYLTAV